jgi:hypothetical protein
MSVFMRQLARRSIGSQALMRPGEGRTDHWAFLRT